MAVPIMIAVLTAVVSADPDATATVPLAPPNGEPLSSENQGPAECTGISGGCMACHATYSLPTFAQSGLGCAMDDIPKVEAAAKAANYMIIGTSDPANCYKTATVSRNGITVNAVVLDVNGGSDDVSWPVWQVIGGQFCGGNRLQGTITIGASAPESATAPAANATSSQGTEAQAATPTTGSDSSSATPGDGSTTSSSSS